MSEQWSRWRGQWEAERDLEKAVGSSAPILAGPWRSEVGYEALYWVPFLRWVVAAYRVSPDRLVIMSRGGTSAWYSGITDRYIEVFDHMSPPELTAASGRGPVKQREWSDVDLRLIDSARTAHQLPPATTVLHPSLMFRWFAGFWSGHETLSFVERHLHHARPTVPSVELPVALPAEYAVAKFYHAQSLPDTPPVRAQVRSILEAIAERMPVIRLDTGLGLDDHAEFGSQGEERLLSMAGKLDARTNLAVQTRIVAGARLYTGTCGSLAWLAPMLGVRTMPVYTDASFLHAHLHVATRVYAHEGAAPFTPVNLAGVTDAGLAVGAARRLLADGVA
jgi:hypothetical protein